MRRINWSFLGGAACAIFGCVLLGYGYKVGEEDGKKEAYSDALNMAKDAFINSVSSDTEENEEI